MTKPIVTTNFIGVCFEFFSLVILLQQCVGSFFRFFLLSEVDGDLLSVTCDSKALMKLVDSK